MNSPILMSSGPLTIPIFGALEPDTSRMRNPFRTAMFVDEIRFRTNTLSTTSNALLSAKVEISLGRTPLTRGFVPIASICKVLQDGNTALDITGRQFIRQTWKLPKPLYVTPEELLVCKLQYDGTYGGPATLVMEVSYAGRSLESVYPAPEIMWVPWVTHFSTSLLAVTSGVTDSTISKPGEINNPFDSPMKVQRFIGRTLRIDSGGSLDELRGGQGDSVPYTMTMVRAVDSLNNILVRDPTPFTHLFQFCDRAWTVNSSLPPKGFYIFTIDRDYTATISGTSIAHAVSMIGLREVRRNG